MLSNLTRLSRVLTFVAIALGFAVSAYAQAINTAPLSGVVRDQNGNPVSGAKVKIIHTPTGTETNVTSASDGSFVSRGLRPGGPYIVDVLAKDFAPTEVREVNLEIEAGAYVPVVLEASDVVKMEKYSVTANTTAALFDPASSDKSTFISNKDIQNMVAGDRTLSSLLANDPRVIYNRDPAQQYISVSGINNRYNSMMVDGVSVSDPFGLNANNVAAFRNVIPVDAVESMSLSTSPYNVRKSGFTGAYINAVTKSGGNDFHGSLYYTFRNQDLAGEHLNGKSYPLSNFKEQTFGATLSGPIVPNKVFFFASFERVTNDVVAPAPGTPLDQTTMDKLMTDINLINTTPAINTGTTPFNVGTPTAPTGNKLKDIEALAKVEWQVNADNRVTVQYKYSSGDRPTFPGFPTNSTSINNFSFSNSWYSKSIKNTSYSANWISQWTDKLNTEVSLSYSKYDSTPKYSVMQPYVTVQNIPVITATGTLGTTSYASWGTDYSSQVNILSTKTKTAEIFASYKLGWGHTLDAGVQYNNTDVYNLFVQNAFGRYTFNTFAQFDDYANGRSKNIYQYTYNQLISGVDPAANFTEANAGIFVRDQWKVTDRLNIEAGLRMDVPIINDSPRFNQKFYDTFNMRNDATYNGQTVIQPRLGFNWSPKINSGKFRTVLRGGAGLFYGAMPRVWLSNSYSNTGLNYITYQAGTSYAGTTSPKLSSDPYNQPTGGQTPAQTVAFMDPNFKLPTRWKANIALDQELGLWGMKFTAELEGSKVEQDVAFKNVNIQSNYTGPDGRPIYWGTFATSGTGTSTKLVNTGFSNQCTELINTNKGHTAAVTFSLERPMKKDGWAWMIAYTNTNTVEGAYGNASTPGANWYNRTAFDPNAVEPHRGDGEIRNRYMVNLTKQFNFFKFGSTTVTVTFNRRNGLPFSLVSNGDTNGDGQNSNDLIYVPNYNETSINGTTKYVFTSAQARDDFYAIAQKYGLQQGSKTTINGQRYPWVSQFDVHLAQDVKLPFWRHKLELAVDFLNFANMLNDKWGIIYGSNQAFVKSEYMAKVAYNDNTKSYTYSPYTPSAGGTNLMAGSFAPATGTYVGEPASTRWSILLSAKYKF